MQLHEFMTTYRGDILAECHAKLKHAGDDESLSPYAADFFDETLRALRRDFGMPDSSSPLPRGSEAAARLGAERQRAGLPVTKVPVMFAALSQSIGITGERYELTISAEEYKALNACLDAGLAASIENFWRQDNERQNRIITERFGFMAHELRNALGNASMAFKLLRAGNLPMNGRTADVLGRNLIKMDALVAQSLVTAQLEVGAAPVLVPVHLASVLRNIEASTIPARNISIVLLLDEQLFVSADQMLLTSAISNLVHNAVKFSPPGSTVQLRAHTSGASVVIEVEDQCGGLGHESVAKLFEPYVKRHEGNSTGTGLGLSIAKRAVSAMHGSLEVTDKPGEGCVFTVRFPEPSR